MIVNVMFNCCIYLDSLDFPGPAALAILWHKATMRFHGAWILGSVVLVACHDEKPQPTPVSTTTVSASASGTPSVPPLPSVKSEEKDEPASLATPTGDVGAFAIGALSDIAPAGPATASSLGVVMVTKNEDFPLAEPSPGKAGSFRPIQRDAASFKEFGPGPAVTGNLAYFISNGRLRRRRVKPIGPLEALAEDARDGTRVAAIASTAKHPAAALYIAKATGPAGDSVGMLWVEGSEPVRLSPEGSAASSVALLPSGEDLIVLMLEGRTGMTPVHARRVRLDGKKAELDEDVVVWVAGPAQATTEIAVGARSPDDAWAFIPLERDVTRFGLAQVHLGTKLTMGSPVLWRAYPNGVDPAPVATLPGCGRDLVAYTRPKEANPKSAQELHLATLEPSGLGPSQIIARARTITNVSVAPLGASLLVAYVADGRTWAATLSCPDAKKAKKN